MHKFLRKYSKTYLRKRSRSPLFVFTTRYSAFAPTAGQPSGRITFEQAMLLSLFYKDFNETNQIVTEAAAIFQEDEELLNEILSVCVNQFYIFLFFYDAKLNANRLYNLTQKCIIDNNTVNFTL